MNEPARSFDSLDEKQKIGIFNEFFSTLQKIIPCF